MTSESVYGEAPKLGLDIALEDDGQTLKYVNPVCWDEWVQLPVRPCDFSIKIGHGGEIRAPVVVLCATYSKMPTRTPSLNSSSIFERDKHTCQYCGRTLSRKELNLDHIIPESRGGPSSWTNLVTSCIHCNTTKADRLPHEAGMRLLRRPTTPKSTPISFSFRDAKHPMWAPFIHEKN